VTVSHSAPCGNTTSTQMSLPQSQKRVKIEACAHGCDLAECAPGHCPCHGETDCESDAESELCSACRSVYTRRFADACAQWPLTKDCEECSGTGSMPDGELCDECSCGACGGEKAECNGCSAP